MIRFVDRRGRKICLGPTHEEVITELVKSHVSSYKQLPVILYQIQTKFRDEIRPRFGVVRACEFIMKDAYSFDRDEAGLDKNYQAMYRAYQNIFGRCGLNFLSTEADTGIMGGSASHEFMVPAASGEDLVWLCPQCKGAQPFVEGKAGKCPKCKVESEKVNCIEVGHIFKLGTKYSSTMGANFLDEKGKQKPLVMGCYGIGVSRLLATIIEQNYDADGIIWPKEVSPYQMIILPLDVNDKKTMDTALEAYRELEGQGVAVLLDDRDERAGVKFKDADLLGISLQLIVGKESLKNNTLELKVRRSNKKIVENKAAVFQEIRAFLNG
jgi:prolyl-tRNA synthetase